MRKGVRLTFDTPPSAITMRGDARLFRQIVLNLVSNAIKFTPAGGLVTVKLWLDGDGLRLQVADEGEGIPAHEIPNVTKVFYQVDQELSRRHEGTGLGLALVKSFVELHHGSFKITSELHKGTRVDIVFPKAALAGGDREAA
jgi:cell cycle sensor histidine kinase DivJ